MALRQTKLCVVLRRLGSPFVRQNNATAVVSIEGHRHLTTNPKYEKAYPYKTKRFNILRSIFDFTTSRINENSRIIMVEGPPCVGKTEFAKKLAQRFNLLHIPSVTEDDLFNVNGFDTRQLNEMMPSPKMKKYDLSMFYSEKDPEQLVYYGLLQIEFFQKKLQQYVEANRHVLSTGMD